MDIVVRMKCVRTGRPAAGITLPSARRCLLRATLLLLGSCAVGLLLSLPLAAQQASAPRPEWSLQLRPGYYGIRTTAPDGNVTQVHEGRVRVQARVRWSPDARFAIQGRLAGRLSTEQERFRFLLQTHVPNTTGLGLGEATMDELQVEFRPTSTWAIRGGRLQTGSTLVGVAAKSLDRNDCPNTDVFWTDGVEVVHGGASGWRANLIFQRHGAEGPGNVIRAPLDVTLPGARWGGYLGVERRWPDGLPAQAGAGLTLLPNALPAGPAGSAEHEAAALDYVGVTGRGAVRLAGGGGSPSLLLGAEVGWAPRTPDRSHLGTGPAGSESAGFAWQASASVVELARRHEVGILAARIGDGWLISPDLRANNAELEARYRLRFDSGHSFEARIRERSGIWTAPGSERTRRDVDVYARMSLRFSGR